MGKSPGHQKWPDHKVQEKPVGQTVQVKIDGDQYPTRYYFPRSDIKMDNLERSDTTTECPFKGTAHYYHLNLGDRKFEDAVWTDEDPYEEHRELKDRLAFYDDKILGIHIEIGPNR